MGSFAQRSRGIPRLTALKEPSLELGVWDLEEKQKRGCLWALCIMRRLPDISCTFPHVTWLSSHPYPSLFFFQVQASRFQHKAHSLKKSSSSSAPALVDFLLLPSTVLSALPVWTTLGYVVCWSGHSRVLESIMIEVSLLFGWAPEWSVESAPLVGSTKPPGLLFMSLFQ